MSARKTKSIFITTSSGTFATFDEAVKAANAIKIWLTRLCERKGYSCKATIGISENNPKTGKVTGKRTGKRGRPQNVFVYDRPNMLHKRVNPHIHVVMVANPAETIAQTLVKYLIDKYGEKAARYEDCSEFFDTAMAYLKKQSLKTRYAESNSALFSFTTSNGEETAEDTDSASVSDGGNTAKELQCNNNKLYLYSIDTAPKERILLPINKVMFSGTSPPS